MVRSTSAPEGSAHWTVAHKVTARAVEFFDSDGMSCYPFTRFTLDKAKAGDQPRQKIMIDVHHSFRLRRGYTCHQGAAWLFPPRV